MCLKQLRRSVFACCPALEIPSSFAVSTLSHHYIIPTLFSSHILLQVSLFSLKTIFKYNLIKIFGYFCEFCNIE